MEDELAKSPWWGERAIVASGAEVRRAGEWLAENCRQCNVPQGEIERLELCLHEALANVISHGGSTALASPIRMRLEIAHDAQGSKASVTVTDAGVAFNPLSVPDRIAPKTLAEAPSSGGLGLIMLRRCADWLDYRREGGHNHLTFGMRWHAQ